MPKCDVPGCSQTALPKDFIPTIPSASGPQEGLLLCGRHMQRFRALRDEEDPSALQTSDGSWNTGRILGLLICKGIMEEFPDKVDEDGAVRRDIRRLSKLVEKMTEAVARLHELKERAQTVEENTAIEAWLEGYQG